ncbi:MAG: GAK system ATP-grasp enzyme [Desulfobacterales bacterium]|nr:GAK system ATP-grasp enzyme [Desulfobacterales bacterium]
MKGSLRIGVIGIPGTWSSEALADAVAKETGSRFLLDAQGLSLDLGTGQVHCQGYCLNDFHGLVVKKIGSPYSPDLLNRLEILKYLEGQGVAVFNRPSAMMSLLNRLSCTIVLQLEGIPMPPTTVTESFAEAHEAVTHYGRAILKPLYTSKAEGMEWVEKGEKACEILERYQSRHGIFYIQKAVEFGDCDLGVLFLGGNYLTTYTRICGGPEGKRGYQGYNPAPEIIELAQKAQRPFGLDFTCVDIALTPEGPFVFEVSAFGGFKGALKANGLDVAGRFARWVVDRLKQEKRLWN